MRRWGVLRFAVLALAAPLAAPAPPSEPPARAAAYVLAESRKSVSPAGEVAAAVRGPVTVLAGSARWDLESGSFPRTTANAVVMGDREGWLVDRKAGVAARANLQDVNALFLSPDGGEPGPFQSSVREVSVPPGTVSAGPSFEGRPTVRLRVTASWTLVTATPTRVGRVLARLNAVVDVLEEAPEGARSPLDDLERLFDVPRAVREALAPELARVPGLPVGVVVETDAELAVDYPGMAPPQQPDGRAPLTTRTEGRRTVSGLLSRAAAAGDAAAFVLPEGTRVVGIERLVESRETLR